MEESKRMVRSLTLLNSTFCANIVIVLMIGVPKTSNDMVSGQGQHSLLWNFCQGGYQRRAGFPDYCEECFGARSWDWIVSWIFVLCGMSYSKVNQYMWSGMPTTLTQSGLTPRAHRTTGVTAKISSIWPKPSFSSCGRIASNWSPAFFKWSIMISQCVSATISLCSCSMCPSLPEFILPIPWPRLSNLISDFYSFSALRAFYGLEERVKRLNLINLFVL